MRLLVVSSTNELKENVCFKIDVSFTRNNLVVSIGCQISAAFLSEKPTLLFKIPVYPVDKGKKNAVKIQCHEKGKIFFLKKKLRGEKQRLSENWSKPPVSTLKPTNRNRN